jgi:hypothetical protein
LSRGVPRSLHTLRLEGEISDEDALLDVLGRHADVLRGLQNLSLPLLDEVSLCAVERAKELLPCYVDQSNESTDDWYMAHEDGESEPSLSTMTMAELAELGLFEW